MAMKSSSAWWAKVRRRITTGTADATDNLYIRDTVGNKTDAAITTVGTTKSLMAYVKGLVNQVAAIIVSVAAIPTSKRCEFEQVVSSTPGTVLTVTGSGKLYSVTAYNDTSPRTTTVTIVIDGESMGGTCVTQVTDYLLPPSSAGTMGVQTAHYNLNWEFQDSLVISFTVDGGTGTVNILYGHD